MSDDLSAVLDEGLVAMRSVGMRYAARAGRPDAPEGFVRLSALVDEPGMLEELLQRAGERWETDEQCVRVALVLPPLIARLTRVACGCLSMGLPMPRMRGEDVLVHFSETSLVREMRLVGPVVSGDPVAAIRDDLPGTTWPASSTTSAPSAGPAAHRCGAQSPTASPAPASSWVARSATRTPAAARARSSWSGAARPYVAPCAGSPSNVATGAS